MVGFTPAIWRIVYRRSITDAKVYGLKERENFKFLDDVDSLSHGYVATLECKEFDAGPWAFVAYVVVSDRINETFVLIDDNGEKLVKTPFSKMFMRDFLKTMPSVEYLKSLMK